MLLYHHRRLVEAKRSHAKHERRAHHSCQQGRHFVNQIRGYLVLVTSTTALRLEALLLLQLPVLSLGRRGTARSLQLQILTLNSGGFSVIAGVLNYRYRELFRVLFLCKGCESRILLYNFKCPRILGNGILIMVSMILCDLTIVNHSLLEITHLLLKIIHSHIQLSVHT